MQFDSKTLEKHWGSAVVMFPRLCETPLAVLIPFVTTYLCKSGISNLLSITTKPRNRLNGQADVRVAISNIVPTFWNTHEQETGTKGSLNWNTLLAKFWGSAPWFYYFVHISSKWLLFVLYLQMFNLCHPFLPICFLCIFQNLNSSLNVWQEVLPYETN